MHMYTKTNLGLKISNKFWTLRGKFELSRQRRVQIGNQYSPTEVYENSSSKCKKSEHDFFYLNELN